MNKQVPRIPTKKFLDEILEAIFEKAEYGLWPHSHMSAMGTRETSECVQLGGVVYERKTFASILKEAPEDIMNIPKEPPMDVKWLMLVAKVEVPCSFIAAGISHAKIVARRKRYIKGSGLVLSDAAEDAPGGDIESMRPLQKALFERETRDQRGHETGASQGDG